MLKICSYISPSILDNLRHVEDYDLGCFLQQMYERRFLLLRVVL